MQLLIKNGQIATHEKIFNGDILIEGEKIKKIAPSIKASKISQVLDASGLIILPGLIDIHVHFRDPGAIHKEDFHTGSCAALAGGVTTIVDMPNNNPSIDSEKTLKEKMKIAKNKSVCDYQFYVGATSDNQKEVAKLASKIAGMKLYMGSTTGNLLVADEASVLKHFQTYPKNKPIMLHCEDEKLIQLFSGASKSGHNKNRPPIAAAVALAKALELAKVADRRIHICHISTKREVDLIRQAKKEGIKVTCEVAPHHLFLTEEDQKKKKNFGKMNPPLRSKEDEQALWENLDVIDAIATDHAPHTREEKNLNYEKAPSGVSGVETTLPLLLNGVLEKKLTFLDFVRLTSFGPAKIAGLEKKGELKVGYDADLVLVDPKARGKITNKVLFTKCAWSPFDGWGVSGKIVSTYLRGKEVFGNGRVIAPKAYGKLVTSS
ncbi:MAG: hypothetical protein A2Y57_03650 [Candidatus Woykebacteria bacterium RBG_13_40_7b]|uniref:Amidohydrolase-related domain-containing protein n=1 Tax=Candidatus Woykebacteria bacterium RBG_13_40_7b TaxID=1802594 RepID=A0A1G1WAR9_9BACT|nr:MAG: hypothetical protein A2Y57_03650 [Candidatus Woykebacteria bacterium RBG_13_40_7b]